MRFDELVEDTPVKPQAPVAFDELEDDRDKYGTGTELAKTAIEGALSGATLGFSDVAANELGISTPEARAGRRAANPITHGVTSLAGNLGLVGATGGLGSIIEAPTVAARIGLGAAETAGMAGIEAANDDWSQNKALDAQKIIAHAGIGALLGGVGHSVFEGFKYNRGTPFAKEASAELDNIAKVTSEDLPSFISELDKEAYLKGDFATLIENSRSIPSEEVPKIIDGIKNLKHNAPQIIEAGNVIDAPILEGVISANKRVQQYDNRFLKGPPTLPAVIRRREYDKGYRAVEKATKEALGDVSTLSSAELGNELKASLTHKIEQEVKPLNELYSALKEHYPVLPIGPRTGSFLAKKANDAKILRIAPDSPSGRIVKDYQDALLHRLKTVDDIKEYKTYINTSLATTAPSAEKNTVRLLSKELEEAEKATIIENAKQAVHNPQARDRILGLLKQRKDADTAYAPFRKDLDTLLEKLGKKETHGATDAIDFIKELTPEKITERLFSKKDSEFLQFFSKKFPEEMESIRKYQKKLIYDGATPYPNGLLDPNSVFREVKKLQPEIQRAIFDPYQLIKLKSAEIYYKEFPKDFNPSATSHALDLTEFLANPLKAIGRNISDLGVEQYVKFRGGERAVNAALEKRSVDTTKAINQKVKALFSGFKRFKK